MNNPTPSPESRPKAGIRREGREAAVQFLYQLDLPAPHPAAPDGDFWKLRAASIDPEEPGAVTPPGPATPKVRTFAESLVQGVLEHREKIDACIAEFARNYELQRIATVDRNILRLATYEILFNPNVPAVVAINEAIEIAKKYGTEDSGRFVNGILDKIRTKGPKRPSKAASNSLASPPLPEDV